MITFLAIDDTPGRFDDFVRKLNHEHNSFVLSCDQRVIVLLIPLFSNENLVILLDHDMPGWDGRKWASELHKYARVPVVIVSTTGVPGAVDEMERTLRANNMPVYVCPADHYGCELEWIQFAEEFYKGNE